MGQEQGKYNWNMWLICRLLLFSFIGLLGCKSSSEQEEYLVNQGIKFESCKSIVIVVNTNSCVYCNLGVFRELDKLKDEYSIKVLANDTAALSDKINGFTTYQDSTASWLRNGINIYALGYIVQSKNGFTVGDLEGKNYYKFLAKIQSLKDSCSKVGS